MSRESSRMVDEEVGEGHTCNSGWRCIASVEVEDHKQSNNEEE